MWLYTSGDLDTLGILYDGDQNRIAYSTHGFVGEGQDILNFHLRWDLPAGVYYVRVISEEGVTGNYTFHARSVTVSSAISTVTAVNLTVDSTVAGTLRSASDGHYYRLDVTRSLSLRIIAQGALLFDDNGILAEPAIVEILDSGGNEISVNTFSRVLRSSIFGTYLFGNAVVDDFSPGTYFIRVIPPEGSEHFQDFQGSYPVPYTLFLREDLVYPAWIASCETATDSLGNSDIEDPLYGCQWHLNNSEPDGHDINVEGVWAEGHMGQGVNVVVVDETIDYGHEDLTGNVNYSRNHDYYGGGEFRPYEHHGTNVAGLVAAQDNHMGVRGVAPRATLYGYNLVSENLIRDADLLDAMSRGHLDTAVSNNSWGPAVGPGYDPLPITFWENAVEMGVREGFGGKGTFYVFTAGNGALVGADANLNELGNYYAVTTVCAVGDGDVRNVYSEIGANLWVCAPSLDEVEGEEHRGIVTAENSNRYIPDFSGTSASAPIVSGTAAMLREVNPELTWRDLKLVLAAAARKNDPASPGWGDGAVMYGSDEERYNFNHEYGFGMVDAGAAAELAKDWKNLPPLFEAEVASDANLGRLIPDASQSGTITTVIEKLSLDTDVRFIEYVEIEVDFDHESLRDLELQLESPSGAVSRILAPFDTRELEETVVINGVPVTRPLFIEIDGRIRLGSAKHLGEDPNGEWTLRVRDHFGEKDGTLRAWSIKVYGHGADCWQRISGDQVVSGGWDESQCTSVDRQGNASRYYSFSLGEESEVTIKLESETDPYLYLRAGEARSGTALHENDDHEDTSRTISQISERLTAGSYTIEATTYEAGATGSFTLTVSGLGTGETTEPGPEPEPSDVCGDDLTGDGATTDRWDVDCDSEGRSGSYARYYSFTVAQESEVTIKLESETDPYLYLRAGEARSGTALHENDDHEDTSRTISQISERLTAGSYTIEATTYEAGATGSFTLTVSGLGTGETTEPGPEPEPSDVCGDDLTGDGATTDRWDVDCDSEGRSGSYARYYSFTVAQESEVTIKLESETDPYLYLRAGEARSGTALHENDDHEDTSRTISQISERLTAGSYTIEATTYEAGATGSFTLTVSGLGTGETTEPGPEPEPSDVCGDDLTGDGATTDRWDVDCDSEGRSGSYARYYSFTVAQESEVTIKLESETDPYLYLRAGEARSGTALHENDDHEDTSRTISQISERLTAGSYTIEATTYEAGATGSFTLTISLEESP